MLLLTSVSVWSREIHLKRNNMLGWSCENEQKIRARGKKIYDDVRGGINSAGWFNGGMRQR